MLTMAKNRIFFLGSRQNLIHAMVDFIESRGLSGGQTLRCVQESDSVGFDFGLAVLREAQN